MYKASDTIEAIDDASARSIPFIQIKEIVAYLNGYVSIC